MDSKVWVIRKIYVGYTDEYYFLEKNRLGSMHGLFTSKQEAIEEWHRLELKNARQDEHWWNMCEFGEDLDPIIADRVEKLVYQWAEQQLLQEIPRDQWQNVELWVKNEKLLDFVLAENPKSFFGGYTDRIFKDLSDAQIIEFIFAAEANRYVIVEFDNHENYQVLLWKLSPKISFYNNYHKCTIGWKRVDTYWSTHFDSSSQRSLHQFSSFDEETFSHSFERWIEHWLYSKHFFLQLEGDLLELSYQPSLLHTVIKHTENLYYDDVNQVLTITSAKALFKVNALLIAPIFELKQLNLQQFVEIESAL